MDIRLFFSFFKRSDWSQCRWNPEDDSLPEYYRISPLSHNNICYTSEALFYAQSAYFAACVGV